MITPAWSASASLAQRQEPARLLVLGTYRQAEVVIRGHPLRGMVQELCGRGQAAELRLEVLPAEDVAAYVAGRLGGPAAVALAAFIYERTDGNALFMVNMLEHLVQHGEVVRRGGEWTLREEAEKASVPEGLRQLLLRRLEALHARGAAGAGGRQCGGRGVYGGGGGGGGTGRCGGDRGGV